MTQPSRQALTTPPSILVLHGPNLNRLGNREPEKYGQQTLDDIDQSLRTLANTLDIELQILQSNHEGVLVDRIHQAGDVQCNGIIINPAAFTHTSVAIRDALLAVALPCIEVHLSNVHRREQFRHHSFIADIAIGTISGLGAQGYLLALRGLHHHLNQTLSRG
ncbi:MAG: type II 3-dehydroquinate dehydratase [Mariprofundales bacterium]